MSGNLGTSDGTLTGVLCLLAVRYSEEIERHLTGHRGRTAVVQDHRQEQDREALRFPAVFPGWNLWAHLQPPPNPQNKGLPEDSNQGRQGKLGLGKA